MLFTVILEFEGTTSVSQSSARNIGEAYRNWLQGLKDPVGFGLSVDQAERLASALSLRGCSHLHLLPLPRMFGAQRRSLVKSWRYWTL